MWTCCTTVASFLFDIMGVLLTTAKYVFPHLCYGDEMMVHWRIWQVFVSSVDVQEYVCMYDANIHEMVVAKIVVITAWVGLSLLCLLLLVLGSVLSSHFKHQDCFLIKALNAMLSLG